jgi:hypothetical protein
VVVVSAITKDNFCGQLIQRRIEDQPCDPYSRMAGEVPTRGAVVDGPAVILARHRIIGAGAVLPARMATDERCLDRERERMCRATIA